MRNNHGARKFLQSVIDEIDLVLLNTPDNSSSFTCWGKTFTGLSTQLCNSGEETS